MQIIGDRHYQSDPNETVTFSVADQDQVGDIKAVVNSKPAALPVDVSGGHTRVTITVGFTGDSGGSAVIDVAGANGGDDQSRIRQLDGLPFRSAIFIVE